MIIITIIINICININNKCIISIISTYYYICNKKVNCLNKYKKKLNYLKVNYYFFSRKKIFN